MQIGTIVLFTCAVMAVICRIVARRQAKAKFEGMVLPFFWDWSVRSWALTASTFDQKSTVVFISHDLSPMCTRQSTGDSGHMK
jgi:hypothetical protein